MYGHTCNSGHIVFEAPDLISEVSSSIISNWDRVVVILLLCDAHTQSLLFFYFLSLVATFGSQDWSA